MFGKKKKKKKKKDIDGVYQQLAPQNKNVVVRAAAHVTTICAHAPTSISPP